jgi:hypothetical protein
MHAPFAMRRLIVVLVLCCMETLLAKTALAQSDEPEYREWEVAGFTGASFAGDYHFTTAVVGSGSETARRVGMKWSPGYLIGVRINQYFREYWQADLEYSFALQNVRFTNISPDNPTISINNYIHHIDYNVGYMPLRGDKRFRPYFNVGTGAVLFFLNGTSLAGARAQGLNLRQSTWQFLVNWGGGAKYLIVDQFAVSFDVKDSYTGIPKYAIPSTSQVINGQFIPGVAIGGAMHNWQVSGSANYQWDEWNFKRKRRRD